MKRGHFPVFPDQHTGRTYVHKCSASDLFLIRTAFSVLTELFVSIFLKYARFPKNTLDFSDFTEIDPN